jgi:hypothetical protein
MTARDRRSLPKGSAIQFQIHLRGRALSLLTHEQLSELVIRKLDGEYVPKGIDVRIQAWRAGIELAWELDNSRAATLRHTIRRLLQDRRITLQVRED